MKYSPSFGAIGWLSLTIGIPILLWHLTSDVYVLYISNLTPGWPTEISPLDNSPLVEYLLIFPGILSIKLTNLRKTSGYFFSLLSWGIILTFATAGSRGDVSVGGLPLSWWWTTFGTCANCRHPYFIMLFPFLADLAIWIGLASIVLSTIFGLKLTAHNIKHTEQNSNQHTT